MSDDWPDRLLSEKFTTLTRELDDLRESIKVLSPLATHRAVLDSKVDDIQRDVGELKAGVAKLQDRMNDTLRATRADSLTRVAQVVLPSLLVAAAIIAALLTGKVPA